MNPLFSLPLHGICCTPSPTHSSAEFCMEVALNFCSIKLDPQLTPIWALKDEGQRYLSEVTLYKEAAQSNNKSNNKSKTNNKNNNQQPSPSYFLKINCQGNGIFKINTDTLARTKARADATTNTDNISIDWQENGTDSAHYFQTLTAALYLELNKVLCIHANALAYNDQAIAFVAPSRTGKTTLTAALSQQGFALMTDDMIALHHNAEKNEYTIYPSWPVARMWPDTLAELVDNNSTNSTSSIKSEQCEKVHQNFAKRIVPLKSNSDITFDFCDQAKKLKVIYLLNREQNEQNEQNENKINNQQPYCFISTIPAAAAVIILLKNSILGSAYGALGLEHERVIALAKLVNTIQFKQISYSSGKNNLLNVCEKIKQDLQTS